MFREVLGCNIYSFNVCVTCSFWSMNSSLMISFSATSICVFSRPISTLWVVLKRRGELSQIKMFSAGIDSPAHRIISYHPQ